MILQWFLNFLKNEALSCNCVPNNSNATSGRLEPIVHQNEIIQFVEETLSFLLTYNTKWRAGLIFLKIESIELGRPRNPNHV